LDGAVKIDVLLFAGVAEAAGCEVAHLTLEGRPSIAAIEAALCAEHPTIAPLIASVRWACNERFVDRSHRFSRGEVLAVIPPVAGG
jgi:molybdopterin synthase sulfur carrier subunit